MSGVGGAAGTFSAHASEYDGARRRLIPDLDGFYGALVDALGAQPAAPRRVLDLGAGTRDQAGLGAVDCVDKRWRFAVISGVRETA